MPGSAAAALNASLSVDTRISVPQAGYKMADFCGFSRKMVPETPPAFCFNRLKFI
jgi:hypothetical protein